MKLLLPLVLAAVAVPASGAEKITKERLPFNGTERTFYLFVPEASKGRPSPLVITLHGSGRDGRILIEHWQDLARKEGIILVGPDATDRQGWNIAPDGPHLMYELVETIKKRHSVDPRRVYIFGHSAGATHGLHLGVLESEYFAAVSAHAGVIMSEFGPYLEQAGRKIPMALWVGSNDRFFPVSAVRGTRDTLVSRGFPAEFTEIKGHTHDYYGRSSRINTEVWEFLRRQQLSGAPRYQLYSVGK